MPKCKGCGFCGEPGDFDPCASAYHDFRCPKCGTTAIDTSDMGKDYGYGDNNVLNTSGK